MDIAIRYYSRTGNTKKLAMAMAGALGIQAHDCSVALSGKADLLFLGGAVYGFGLDNNIKNYIAGLNPHEVGSVALFGTSAIVKSGNREMAELLAQKGIKVLSDRFHCHGAFTLMHRGRPNASDLKRAVAFALAVIDSDELPSH